jgi:hypothetical protein
MLVVALGLGCEDKTDVAQTLPLDCPDYLISKERYKSVDTYRGTREPETVKVDTATYKVYLDTESEFTYDKQRRIVKEVSKGPDYTSTTSYTYTADSVISTLVGISTKPPYNNSYRSAIRLNKQGYDAAGVYDEQGYRIGELLAGSTQSGSTQYKWTDGNLESYTSGSQGSGWLTRTFTYDLTRPSLPDKTPIQGRSSKNLLTSLTVTSKGDPFYSDDVVLYRRTYHYLFDKQGRVKRSIVVEYNNPTERFGFRQYTGSMGLTDYEYTCP